MEQVRRRNTGGGANQLLLILIAVLVILLAAAVFVAVSLRADEPEATEPSENTVASTVDSTEDTTLPAPQIPLTVTQPQQTEFVSVEQALVFAGTADPQKGLTINGTAVELTLEGKFTHTLQLIPGMNEIQLTSGAETLTYRVEYRYAVQRYFPSEDMAYNCGATIQLEVFARKGSQLQVMLGDKTISMKEDENQVGNGMAEGFVRYTGTYRLPDNNTEDLTLGQIQYTVTCGDVTETYTSGTITCQKSSEILGSNPAVTPNYGEYMDVGSGYIVEIITYSAETFDGKTDDDKSSPLRNYLPEGTLDYASTKVITKGSNSYMLLRCGRRVYVKKNNWPSTAKVQVVDCYKGTLPDHNEIGFVSLTQEGKHTVLTFDALWKAPFYFDLLPQKYNNEEDRDYRITQLTAEYVDITFCYATKFTGSVEIPGDNPLFKSAELRQNKSDCTLRLYLKKTGGFYGWTAYYNDKDQLCFQFLNPAKVTAADNAYGADLTGVEILLDVGHGGRDPGVVRQDKNIDEAELNLMLANVLRKELESMGATVIMNRTDDATLNTDERIQHMKEQAADLCIAIHQNSINGYPNHSGVEVCYSTPFSALVSQLVFQETEETGLYQRNYLKWHYYFVARQTECPVVLLENGFMSNEKELAGMMDESVLLVKAQAMARGVAQYFLQINQ